MILSRTPYRVSLFGGGSDYPSWYLKHGGKCLSFTINKYSYITARELPPFFDHRYRISYSQIEAAVEIDELKNPAFREVIRKFAKGGVEIHHHGDLPAKSGLGSSSAFVIGLINSIRKIYGLESSKLFLAKESIYMEQSILNETVGSQDQIACSYGGLNFIQFETNGHWKITPIKLDKSVIAEIENHMVLVYSGVQRFSSEIAKPLLKTFQQEERIMLRTMEIADEGFEILKGSISDLHQIGDLLCESWNLKSAANPLAVTPRLREIYETGVAAGALGGKVLGSGGGGFMLFWCTPSRRAALLKALSGLIVVPFSMEFQGAQLAQNWEI